MIFARVVLVLTGLIYLAFGIFFLVDPEQAATIVCYWLGGPTAFTEVRAFYGGLEIGLAAFLVVCAAVRRFVPAGLLATLLLCGGTAAGRLVGMVVDESRSTVVVVSLAVELVVVALAAIALWRVGLRPREKANP